MAALPGKEVPPLPTRCRTALDPLQAATAQILERAGMLSLCLLKIRVLLLILFIVTFLYIDRRGFV
jgi:hypothetical protein